MCVSFRSLIILTIFLLIGKEFYINIWLIFPFMVSVFSFMFQHFAGYLISIQLNGLDRFKDCPGLNYPYHV